jgi:exodeoxyribonuclease-3
VADHSSLGIDAFDCEGRVLQTHFSNFTLINAYFPNSQREHERLPYKLDFCKAMILKLEELRSSGRTVVLCGDFNISHKAIDLKNPKANENNAGYLPEERAWMDFLIDDRKYIDTFRYFDRTPENYTWWSYRPGIRERNIGWRLDYFVTHPEAENRLRSSLIRSEVRGSDHCPVVLEIDTQTLL